MANLTRARGLGRLLERESPAHGVLAEVVDDGGLRSSQDAWGFQTLLKLTGIAAPSLVALSEFLAIKPAKIRGLHFSQNNLSP